MAAIWVDVRTRFSPIETKKRQIILVEQNGHFGSSSFPVYFGLFSAAMGSLPGIYPGLIAFSGLGGTGTFPLSHPSHVLFFLCPGYLNNLANRQAMFFP